MDALNLQFRSLSEERIGTTWKAVFDHGWPGWRKWYLSPRNSRLPSVEVCRRMLNRHMPEMVRLWDGWVDAAGGDEDVARFLSFWDPPRYLVSCSQIALVDDEGPLLIRNYDLDPAVNEATILKTGWRGRRVIGMVEGMAGLADGMNDAGLALSLTFGGRVERGRGFGIPLIMRYVLETCRDRQDALAAFEAVPCHMSYNITLVDRQGAAATLFLSPDRPLIQRDVNWATNHQLGVELPRHGRVTRTLERDDSLRGLMAESGVNGNRLAREFLAAPLCSRNYRGGFGTIYTALYRPAAGKVSLGWGDGVFHDWSFDDFPDRGLQVEYSPQGSRASVIRTTEPKTDELRRQRAVAGYSIQQGLGRWFGLKRPKSAV